MDRVFALFDRTVVRVVEDDIISTRLSVDSERNVITMVLRPPSENDNSESSRTACGFVESNVVEGLLLRVAILLSRHKKS